MASFLEMAGAPPPEKKATFLELAGAPIPDGSPSASGGIIAALDQKQPKPNVDLSTPIEFGKALGSFGAGAAQGLANIPVGAANLINKTTGIGGKTQPFTFANKMPYQGEAKFGEAIAPMAVPFAGEEALGVKIAGTLAKGKEAGTAANLIGKGVARGAYGGMAGSIFGSENPEEESKNNAVYGALLNTVGRAPFEAVPFAARGITKYYRGLADKGVTPSPEDAKVILDTFGNDVISYGDLVKSPKLRSFYHGFLKYVPFSGVSSKQKSAIQGAESNAGKVIGDLFGDSSESDILKQRQHIQQQITEKAEANKTEVSKKYDAFFDKADAANVTFKPVKTKEVATNILQKDIEGRRSGVGPTSDSAELADVAKLLKIKGKQTAEGVNPIITSGGQDISEYLPEATIKMLKEEELRTATDKPVKFSTYKDAIGKWRDKSSDAYSKGKYGLSRNYTLIANAIDDDMQTSLKKSGLTHLYDEHEAIKDEFKNKVVPFYHSEDPDMLKLIDGKLDLSGEKLESTLADTRNGAAVKQLPQDLKHKVGARMLSNNIPDNGEFLLPRTAAAYDKLKKVGVINQFLDDNAKSQLNKISEQNQLLKPAMEAQKSKIWQSYYKMKNAAIIAGIPFYHFFKMVSSPTLIAGTAALGAAAKGTAKAFESDALKQAYITGKIPVNNTLSTLGRLTSKSAIGQVTGGSQ